MQLTPIAERGDLLVQVLDQNSGEPISRAELTLLPGVHDFEYDAVAGTFSTMDLVAVAHDFNVSPLGYENASADVLIESGMVTSIVLFLTPAEVDLYEFALRRAEGFDCLDLTGDFGVNMEGGEAAFPWAVSVELDRLVEENDGFVRLMGGKTLL